MQIFKNCKRLFEGVYNRHPMKQEFPLLYKSPRRSNPKILSVTLFEPQQPTICPITQDDIMESELHFLEGSYVVDGNSRLRGFRLNCKHEFCAMNLLYYWTRNSTVLCPVCRDGFANAHIDIRKLPQHIQAKMARQIRSERRKDKRERLMADEESARRLQLQSITDPNEVWFYQCTANNVFCAVLREVSENMFFGMRFPLTPHILDNTCFFYVDITDKDTVDNIRGMGKIVVLGLLGSVVLETKFHPGIYFELNKDAATHHVVDVAGCKFTVIVDNRHVHLDWKMPYTVFQDFAVAHATRETMLTLNHISNAAHNVW